MENSNKFSNLFSNVNNVGGRKKSFPIIKVAGGLIVLLLVFSIYQIFKSATSHSSNPAQVAGASTTSQGSTTINKDFTFPLRDAKGDEISKFKFSVLSAELKDEVVLKGQKASLTDSRQFLTVNFKVTNDTKQDININTRRYFRLVVNDNEKEPLAPAIYNDPVDVQAISVTPVSLGFIINRTDKNPKLKIGEVDGEKTTIDLKFPK